MKSQKKKEYKKKIKLNIFTKLIMVTLSLIILPLVILGTNSTYNFVTTTKKSNSDALANSTENKVDIIEQAMSVAISDMDSFSGNPDAKDLLTSIKPQENTTDSDEIKQKVESMENTLKRIQENSNGLYENLFYCDISGNEVASALGVELNSASDSTKNSEGIVMNATDGISISDVTESPVTKNTVTVISTAVLNDAKEVIGSFSASVEFSKLTEMLVKKVAGTNYSYYLINGDGEIISHENKDYIFKLNFSKQNDTTKQALEEMKKSEKGTIYYTLNDDQKIASYSKLSSQGWYVVTESSMSEYTKPVNKMIVNTVVIAIVCGLIAIVCMFFFSKSIADHLKSLTKSMDTIASGNLTKEINIAETGDEIEALSSGFKAMQTNVKDLISKISDMGRSVAESSSNMLVSSNEISKISEEIAATVTDMAEGAVNQAESTAKGNEKIKSVVTGIKNIAKEMDESKELAQKASVAVEDGQKSVKYQGIKMNENKLVSNNVSESINILSEHSRK